MDARLEVMHSKRPDRPLLATGRDRAEGRREEKLRERSHGLRYLDARSSCSLMRASLAFLDLRYSVI
jgi:hypothetical protein